MAAHLNPTRTFLFSPMAEKLKSFYFNHDENASSDIKLLALRSQLAMEGYGIYWFLIEQLSMAGGRMQLKMLPMLASMMQTTPDKALAVVNNYDLFVVDEEGFFSERLNKQLEKRGVLSEMGRRAGLASAENRRIKAIGNGPLNTPFNGMATDVQPEEKRREEDRIEEKTYTLPPADAGSVSDIFKRTVLETGGLKYTRKMLNDFISYWSEPNRAKKPKMRFELEKTWELGRRLSTWASKTRDYECLLTESQQSMAEKKHDFAKHLEKYLEKYPRPMLNDFYAYWTQPENVSQATRIRWELEPFWDLGQRLSQWASRNPQVQSGQAPAQRHQQPQDR